jgi:hypothetical protein
MCPGCGAQRLSVQVGRKGALYVSCHGMRFGILFLPKARSEGRGVWVRRLADPIQFIQRKEGTTMQVKAEGAVQGYVERRSREGKVYRSVDSM